MKIRNDFVTNSSSSSFILSFKDEDSIYNTLKEQFPENIKDGWSAGDKGYLSQLLDEIKEANRLTKEEIVTLVKDEEEYYIWQLLIEELENQGMSYSEAEEFLETSDGEKMINDAYKEEIKDVLNQIGDNKVTVEIEHGDGGQGEDGVLENYILPNLNCTVVRFSHH